MRIVNVEAEFVILLRDSGDVFLSNNSFIHSLYSIIQDLTFIYVSDVVQAVFLALERGRTGGKYFLSDGGVYSSRTFSDLLRRELGNPWLLRLRVPLWILRAIAGIGELAGRATGKATALNNDKYHIMKQRNWRCDIEPARRELGFHPSVMLDEGVKRSVEWYRKESWL